MNNVKTQPKSTGLGGAVVHFPMGDTADSDWHAPESLTGQTTGDSYPLDTLPGIIGAAVSEVVGVVKCPVALVANSALSTLATACQGVADVRPHAGLRPSPLSLYTLLIGESGERKTTADHFFSKGLEDWCKEKTEELEPELAKYKADLESFEARVAGIKKAISAATTKGEHERVDELNKQLVNTRQNEEPDKVFAPDMLMEDTTPESIAYDLMHKWPAAGILTSEAGSVFGGYGMKADNIAKNLAVLNKVWEGGSMKITRRTSDSFTVDGARVTMGLAVQPTIISKYYEQSGDSARGSGFFARFLLAWPESTIGERTLTVEEATRDWLPQSKMHQFNTQLKAVLEKHYANGMKGNFNNLPVLKLSETAVDCWVSYYNDVEHSMKAGGAMEEAKDIASKSADNAARLAGLFHVFNGGDTLDNIDAERVHFNSTPPAMQPVSMTT